MVEITAIEGVLLHFMHRNLFSYRVDSYLIYVQ